MAHKILVVDDDPVVVRLVESILTGKGYEVSVARDGLEAMVKIKKAQPDLVILDVVMPEINGYDVCYELRFNPVFERLPIILLTETAREITEAVGRRINIDYISKPLRPNDLLNKVMKLLKQ